MKVLIVVLILLFAVNANAVINENDSIDIDVVQSNIDSMGVSSVIVEYESLAFSNAVLNSMNGDTLRAAIESMKLSFRSSVSQQTLNSIQMEYDFVPAFVANVGEIELEELRQNPFVRNIYPNRFRKSQLGESLDIVYPRRNQISIEGVNDWTIAVIDTGVDKSHSFLKTNGSNQVVSEACYSGGGINTAVFPQVDRLCPGNVTATTATGSGVHCTGYDGCDHGTHVAGIAAGSDGVASGANIIAIQVFTGLRDVFSQNICGTGVGDSCIVTFDSDYLAGLNRVYALRNTFDIAAVNMSLGGGYFSSACNNENRPITNIISQLKSAQIATIVASGNDGNSYGISFPACISNAIAVGATSDFDGSLFGEPFVVDERTFYSNNSAQVDIYAPGSLIRSSIPNNRFDQYNGTSMAAPHVAGAFAIFKHAMPNQSVEVLEATLKSVGPIVSHAGVNRRRLSITDTLIEFGFLKAADITPILPLLLDD